MSTNAYIGRPSDNGGEGRYLHSDGYPTHALVVLADLIMRYGAAMVTDVIVDTGDWSTLEGDKTKRYPWHNAERFILVPGYGIANRDWSKPMEGATGEHYEWTYVIHSDGRIFILHNGRAAAVIRAQDVTRTKAQRIEEENYI